MIKNVIILISYVLFTCYIVKLVCYFLGFECYRNKKEKVKDIIKIMVFACVMLLFAMI